MNIIMDNKIIELENYDIRKLTDRRNTDYFMILNHDQEKDNAFFLFKNRGSDKVQDTTQAWELCQQLINNGQSKLVVEYFVNQDKMGYNNRKVVGLKLWKS